ncbi:MAG: fumarylacetoacetate hydrolase family protein [Candidatus Tectomicrobia bacterium]|nr:fumarylacetoacetate hydrolase family protein [Candidatus Tectomicrobia bacterium]
MKFVRFKVNGGASWGIVEGEMIKAIDGPPYGCHAMTGEVQFLKFAKLLSPVTPSKIIGIGVNYKALRPMRPERPGFFYLPPSTLANPGESIIIPPMAKEVCFEGEMAFVIGRETRDISEADALEAVFGVTCANDVSDLTLAREDGTSTRSKCFDTFFPIGPYLVAGLDPNNLTLITRVNGEERQRANTSELVFNVQQIISYLSQIMTLMPGDVISTGTPPGLGPIIPGDLVEVEIEGVGVLKNGVRAG